MWTIIGAALILLGAGSFFFRRKKTQLQPEPLWMVEFDDAGIVVVHPHGELQAVRWNELTRVAIRTTDEGPWNMDLFGAFTPREQQTRLLFFLAAHLARRRS